MGLITKHNVLKYDPHLKAFLTLVEKEFENYRANPTSIEWIVGYLDMLQGVKNLKVSVIQDAL